MGDELWGLAKWIMGGFITIGVAVGGWLWRQAIADIKDLEDNVNAHALNTEKFKTHVAETYSTKSDLVNVHQQLRDTMSRVHERIDSVDEGVKTLIGIVGNGKK